MYQRHPLVLTLLLLVAISLAACAGVAPARGMAPATIGTSTSQSTPKGAPSAPTAPAATQGGETGSEGGAEAALVTYADSAQGFAISYPGPWTRDKSVTRGVKFAGGDDMLLLEFVTPAKPADPLAYAQDDMPTMTAAFPGFKQVNLTLSTEVKDAAVLGFEAQGKSSVTAKTYNARGDRYYMSQTDGRIAVLTVVGPANHYDRESIRDIALTLRVKK